MPLRATGPGLSACLGSTGDHTANALLDLPFKERVIEIVRPFSARVMQNNTGTLGGRGGPVNAPQGEEHF
jgi:hypothetical protein